jgi:YHS domain-containing protein
VCAFVVPCLRWHRCSLIFAHYYFLWPVSACVCVCVCFLFFCFAEIRCQTASPPSVLPPPYAIPQMVRIHVDPVHGMYVHTKSKEHKPKQCVLSFFFSSSFCSPWSRSLPHTHPLFHVHTSTRSLTRSQCWTKKIRRSVYGQLFF